MNIEIKPTEEQLELYNMAYKFFTPKESWAFIPFWAHENLETKRIQLLDTREVPYEHACEVINDLIAEAEFPVSLGASLICHERHEQVYKHKWNDDEYNDSELLRAAMFTLTTNEELFPENWNTYFMEKIKNKTRIEQLAVAGALIAAEIDRLVKLEQTEEI